MNPTDGHQFQQFVDTANEYQFGRYIAQVYSHDIARMLEAIRLGYIEPLKMPPEAAIGVVDEVRTWKDLSVHAKEILSKMDGAI